MSHPALLERTTIGTEDPAPEMTASSERTADTEYAAHSAIKSEILSAYSAIQREITWGRLLASETWGGESSLQRRVHELFAQLARPNTSVQMWPRRSLENLQVDENLEQIIRRHTARILEQVQAQRDFEAQKARHPVGDPQQQELPSHTVAARALRDLTGQPDVELAPALGVSRVSFSRWAIGAPISPMHRSRLLYVHTLAKDAARRLGADEFKSWLVTPIDIKSGEAVAPFHLLKRGLYDQVHRLIVDLPDAHPVIEEKRVGLRRRTLDKDDE